ncbi:hypothetical protein BJV82DRAFT_620414 [Fennellomyces sp. T-0311]|nr:hypothetical protein BJV82DRAFT_620414 [Fennellomyces sp. T-0311]
MEAAAARCVQEVIGYYRLAGRTKFKFQNYEGIRLETFYRQSYCESYYVLWQVNGEDRAAIAKHTIPNFIPLERISDAFFPHDIDTFVRVLHDFLLAYVSRREQLDELKELCKDNPNPIAASSNLRSRGTIIFSVKTPEQSHIDVELIYGNLASELPTKVSITEAQSSRNFDAEQQIFLENKLLEAYKLAF